MTSDLIEHTQLYIGGELTDPRGTDVIDVVSPHTEQVIGRVPHASRADVDHAVATARRAFDEGPWPRLPLADRIEVVSRIKDAIAVRHEEIARSISAQNGSPYSWSVLAQALGAMMVWDAAITVARDFPYEERRAGVLGPILVRREPVGVVAAVVPWNVPQFVAAAKLAPALLAGCSVVLKPSPETPLDAYILGEIAREAGLPEGVLSILPADREVSEYLVGHPDVDKVSFTGSVAAGRRVMEVAARNLTRVTLELGGKSAAVVLPDADLASTVAGVVPAAWMNNGQACVAQTRILAPASRYDEFAEAFAPPPGSWSSAIRSTRRPRSARWSPNGSGSARSTTSGSARRRAPRSLRAAAVRPGRTGAGTSSRRSSAASTTPCGSPARRSSGR